MCYQVLDMRGHQLFAYKLFGHLVAVVGIPAAGQEAVHINHSAEDAADGKIPVGHVRLISLVHFPAGNENKISPVPRLLKQRRGFLRLYIPVIQY